MANIGFNIYIDTDTISPNVIGELWMNMINPNGRWGYSIPSVVIPHERQEMDINDKFDLEAARFNSIEGEPTVQWMKYIQKVRFPTLSLTAYMYWDGDGVMIFHHDSGYIIYSTDYKHDDEWEVWK